MNFHDIGGSCVYTNTEDGGLLGMRCDVMSCFLIDGSIIFHRIIIIWKACYSASG